MEMEIRGYGLVDSWILVGSLGNKASKGSHVVLLWVT